MTELKQRQRDWLQGTHGSCPVGENSDEGEVKSMVIRILSMRDCRGLTALSEHRKHQGVVVIALSLWLHTASETSLGYKRKPFLKTKQSKQTNKTPPGERNHVNIKCSMQDQCCHLWSLGQNDEPEK